MKNIHWPSRPSIFALLAISSIGISACGGGVAGNTYTGNGGIVKIEFQSGGKAYLSTGPVTTNCTYSEKGGNVTLDCEGESTEFSVGDDGALNGPPGGMLTRLTKAQ
jgi:hypothetical protein